VRPPEPPKRRGVPPTLVLWLAGVVSIVVLDQLWKLLHRFHVSTSVVTFLSFLAWLLVIALTLYGLAIAARWVLRKLFWTVGRRLFLSYMMIGVLPFFLFAILLSAILYVIAGVASDANFKAERQASVGQLESQIIDYAVQGKKPRSTDELIEVYDTDADSGKSIPQWLHGSNFSGMSVRGDQPLLLAARTYPGDRTIVFAEPLDVRWARALEDRTGMIIAQNLATERHSGRGEEINTDDDSTFEDFKRRGMSITKTLTLQSIVFFDITEEGGMVDWTSGQPKQERRIFTLISNPTTNLLHFYFGGSTSSNIMKAIFGIITGLTTLLMIMYLFASAFAAVLIFSISRAVNRIEKGTKAVERGDFSYRIKMKPHNQLGEMAQSFDRMTESIASLLSSVAEKERLQSEIEIAASIQRNLLPKEGPQFRGVSFSAHFEPTASIGGDYYDVFNLDKSRLAVAIGDVSGHGLSTGLVMAMVKAAITTLVEEGADETSLFHRLNDLVYRSTERRAFMTLAFTIFDLERGTIRHTNAGHLYPYLLRKDAPEPLSIECPSLPLGVRSDFMTRTVELDLQEGDTIVYLSDGIVEAQDPNQEPFGFEQLEALLAQQPERSPSNIRDAILDAVARHSADRPADDDRTVMILRFDNFKPTRKVAEPALAEVGAV
ncbi:MAG TPA: SpoIIE family protein phosphatase, partial [Thermoanaerobaculia bacterium]